MQTLQEIKDIFLDAFYFPTPNESKPILEQLSKIVEQVNNEHQDRNAKLMEWSKGKFQGKVNEKIYGDITLSQLEFATKIEKIKKVLANIFSLYTTLCDPTLFTQETSHRILSLERNLKVLGMQLPQNPSQSEKHFHSLLHTQSQITMLITKEANIRAKLTNIQASLTPHMTILQKELGFLETLLKKDPNLTTLDGLVHLAAKIAIQIKSLHIVLDNWDAAMKIIIEVHKNFLDKYTLSI